MLSRPAPARLYGVDLDGTVYAGGALIPGILDALAAMRAAGAPVVFLTNNSMRTRAAIAAKLADLGVPAAGDAVYSSGYAAARWLRAQGLDDLFVLGEDGLRDELRLAGLRVHDAPIAAAHLVVGCDRAFSYDKLAVARDVGMRPGARFIACNRDRDYPGEGGRILPGAGPIVAALACALGREPDAVVGKPGTYMLELALADRGATAAEAMIVGDSLASDVGLARAAGAAAVWITSQVEQAPAGVWCARDGHELAALLAR